MALLIRFGILRRDRRVIGANPRKMRTALAMAMNGKPVVTAAQHLTLD
jgi:hypothetical protein